MSYAQKVAEQIEQYADTAVLKGLPEIYKYWSQTYLRPALEEVFGSGNIYQIYAEEIAGAIERTGNGRILSIGSGDCNHEVEVAKALTDRGLGGRFTLVCTELSELRLQRGRELARRENVLDSLEFRVVDVNDWSHSERYGFVFAQHTLHHIVELERLFDQVDVVLEPDGTFFTIDMIGRNGHMRWPEVLDWVNLIWRYMPERYRFNHQFEARHDEYLNWDCSVSGFEGIRAEDILPLLVERFDFARFHACGGVEEVFVDRGYGHNLSIDRDEDRRFIDMVHALNEWLLDNGRIKPTMVFASMRRKGLSPPPVTRTFRNRLPADAVRPVEPLAPATTDS